MRSWALALCAMFLAACGQAESAAQEQPKRVEDIENVDEVVSSTEPIVIQLKVHYTQDNALSCRGVFEQGGAVQCETVPNAIIEVGGIKTTANQYGTVLIGFDRDAPKTETISVTLEDGLKFAEVEFNIAPREYVVSRIDGLPPSQVSPRTEAQIKHIQASTARKNKGFASREQTMWFKDGFDYPLKDFTKTSPFGARRILNGVKKRPHYGVDIAAPVGTPIYAPADGVISLADDDLYFEGAMVLIDHGQGLISMYLHMSAIDVEPGQVVKRGDKLGEVGSRGRSTGPHLCWRLKWRNRHLDPELLTKWPSHEHEND